VDADRAILVVAARQHGCATVEQAVAAGLTVRQIQHRVTTGRFRRLGRRVIAVSGAPESWDQALMAGLLELGPDALVSRRAAAELHGFDGFAARAVEFTVSRRARGRGRGAAWRVHTADDLELVDRATVGCFACTSASRTILDLARDTPAPALRRAIDSANRDGSSSPAYLARRLRHLRGPGRHGVRLVDSLIVDAGGHTELERAFLRLVREAGLPRPTCQRVFRHDGRTIARVDFSFEPQPILVEVSGRRGHSTDDERAKDARRRNELQSLGFVVLEFTFDDVWRRPTYVIATLRAAGL
jgi:very-short-patch-repair endonuclease